MVVFQPHRYTRTRDLMDEFAASFSDASILVMMDIYPAGEKPIRGVKTEVLIRKMGRRGIHHAGSAEDVLEVLKRRLRPGDVVLTLGAGDVWKVGGEVLGMLRRRQ